MTEIAEDSRGQSGGPRQGDFDNCTVVWQQCRGHLKGPVCVLPANCRSPSRCTVVILKFPIFCLQSANFM